MVVVIAQAYLETAKNMPVKSFVVQTNGAKKRNRENHFGVLNLLTNSLERLKIWKIL
jgi:hypothetical protein